MKRGRLLAFAACGLFAVILTSGCSSAPAPPSTTTPVAERDANAANDTTPAEDDAPQGTNATTQHTVDANDAPAQPQVVRVKQPSIARPPEPVFHAERFVLLTTEGPLVVESTFTIDGRVYGTVMQSLLDEMLRLADTNQDGVAMWDEVIESPHFRYGQLGNMAMPNYSEQQNAKRQYDTNLNGRFDRFEVSRFLTQNNGGSRAFDLKSSGNNRGRNKKNSRVLRLLDYDEDGRLSTQEMENARDRLRTRDGDEDELLLPGDFVIAARSNMNNRQRRRNYGADSAAMLGKHADWDQVAYAMQDVYGGQLDKESFQIAPSLFSQLDVDGNGQLTDDELPGLNDAAPQISLSLAFGRATNATPPQASALQLVHLSEELATQAIDIVTEPRRIAVQLPRFEFSIHMNDTFGAVDYEMQSKAQFDRADADGNGYLDEEELPENFSGLQIPFASLDADGDGRLYLKELAKILGQQQAAARSQIRAQADEDEDALFSALDTDNDGRLDAREVAMAPERLKAMDKSAEGTLTSREVPDSMSIIFARGNPAQRDALFNVANAATTPIAADAPTWFRRMDANGDGEISESEFLGTESQFRNYDADADGFVGLGEVQALESGK